NRYTSEQSSSFTSSSAKKLLQSEDKNLDVDNSHTYRILHFVIVVSTISELVICKICKKDIKFTESSSRGLGFKIAVNCDCGVSYINSCPLIANAYEINRRIVAVMRLLGIEIEGLLFCGLMDMARSFYSNTYGCIENLYTAGSAVYEVVIKSAMKEEQEKTVEVENSKENLTVSGDGSSKKRGHYPLFGVITLIRKYTGKILDTVVKSSYCKL
ncbi:hypothetical protein WH47_10751, partial [Habropoda laboriosa]